MKDNTLVFGNNNTYAVSVKPGLYFNFDRYKNRIKFLIESKGRCDIDLGNGIIAQKFGNYVTITDNIENTIVTLKPNI